MTASLLRKFSVTYLFLPNLLFVFGWFTPIVAYPVAVGLAYFLFLELKKPNDSIRFTLKDICWIILFSFVFLFLSGIDGLTTQTRDWIAHNQKYFDLYQKSWPIYFPEVDQYACYYFGYFLVPSFLSKIYGELLPSVLIIWSFLGYALGLSWIYLLLHRNAMAMVTLLFLRGSGHAIFLALYVLKLVNWLPENITPSIRSLLDQNKFSPNQLIPTAIVSGILLFDFLQKKKLDDSFFIVTLLFVWAIFPAASLTLIYLGLLIFQYLVQKPSPKFQARNIFLRIVTPAIILIPTILYFISSQSISSGFLLWDMPDKQKLIFSYFTITAVDLILLYIVLSKLNKINPEFPQYLINILIIGLFLTSLFKIGKYNDLFFRSSMAFSIMIFTLMLRSLVSIWELKKLSALYSIVPLLSILVLFSLMGMFANRGLLRDNKVANHILGRRRTYQQYSYGEYANMYQAIRYGSNEEIAVNQYMVKKGSWFEKYLCKKGMDSVE